MRSLLLPLAVAALLSPAGHAQNSAQKAYSESSQRGNTRIFYWGGNQSIGQLTIDYGQPPWKKQYAAMFDQNPNLRWRLGQNFWTNLDTNIDLTVGGTRLAAGYYYLILGLNQEEEYCLYALDPARVRARKLDSYQAGQTQGGEELVLEHSELAKPAARLQMTLQNDPQNRDRATLTIQFGPHQLTAAVKMHAKG